MTDHPLDPELDHLCRQLHRLARAVHRLDPGTRLQVANDVDDYLERVDSSDRKHQ